MPANGSRFVEAGLKSLPFRAGWRKRMSWGRVLASAALAFALGGAAQAQQAPPPQPAPPAREYNQQILVPGSWFHGVHGIALNKDDQPYAGSLIRQPVSSF